MVQHFKTYQLVHRLSNYCQVGLIENHVHYRVWSCLSNDSGTCEKCQVLHFPDQGSQFIRSTEIIGRCITDCGGCTSKFTGLLYRTNQRWYWDYVAEDFDGSLIGRAGDVVVFLTIISPKPIPIAELNRI